MLNAHTAIRTFRELQFDVKAFLYALYDLHPEDSSEDKGVVEIKWSDGSVDVVPTYEFVRGLCNETFLKVLVGGVAELIPEITTIPIQGGKYQKTTFNLDIQGAPLKAKFPEVGDMFTNLDVIGGTIVKLVADTVSLPSDAIITKLEATEDLSTDNAVVSTTAETDSLYIENGNIQTRSDSPSINPLEVDLSQIRWDVALKHPTRWNGSYDLSVYTQCQSRSVWGLYKVTGYFRYDYTGYDEYKRHFKTYHAGVIVQIPVFKSISYGGSSGRGGGSYTNIEFETYPMPKVDYPDYSMTEEMAESEIPNIVMLYPFKDTSTKDHWYGTCYVTLLEPTEEHQNRVFQVRNPTSKKLKLCNAWAFTTAKQQSKVSSAGSFSWVNATVRAATNIAVGFGGSLVSDALNGVKANSTDTTEYGSVADLNYIEIPPYSSIDFIFKWEIKGGVLYAYMLPMSLSEYD